LAVEAQELIEDYIDMGYSQEEAIRLAREDRRKRIKAQAANLPKQAAAGNDRAMKFRVRQK
jgi:hypothetical protein